MPYTTRAAWDFRGAGSAATKRNSVVGSYTLTESGTPSWSTTGVDLSASTSDRLTLALPVELRIGFAWIIGGFQVTTPTPGADAFMFGLQRADTDGHLGAISFARAPNNGLFGQVYIGSYSATGNHGTLPTDTDCTAAFYKTALGVNNPGFRGRLNSNAWLSSFVYNAGVEYTATSRLVFGSTNANNSRLRMHWFAMGDGDITDAELEAIQADPSLVLPSGGGGPTSTPAFGRYGVRGPVR